VKTAFEKQISLSEEPRTMEEVTALLSTHFTDEFKKKFVVENVIETEEGFQTFGSDFAPYYIPNFSYTDETKAVKKGDSVYLIEYFTYEDGPVYFEDGYQGVKLTKNDGELKIDEVLYTLPEELDGEWISETASPVMNDQAKNIQGMESAEGESKSSPLSSRYLNKLSFIFSGYFVSERQDHLL
jgi:hypothetical protein